MTTDIERQFFDTFGIEPTLKYYCPSCNTELEKWQDSDGVYYRCANHPECDYFLDTQSEDFGECLNYLNLKLIYPQITDRILLGLEEIFAHNKINSTGFFNGFHVEKRNDYWIYQLTYYKGGYYTCGFGKSRKEAFLNQLITIFNDKEVEEKEKQFIKQQVQALFEEE